MNKHLVQLVLPTLLIICISLSCHKHDMQVTGTLTLNKSVIRLDTTVGTKATVTLQAGVSWTTSFSSATNWLSLDKSYGSAGTVNINIAILANNHSSNPQTVTITFSGPANSNVLPVTLTITQQPYTFNLGFKKALGGKQFESVSSSPAKSPDGGWVIAGTTLSNDGEVRNNKGNADAWIVKLNVNGDTVWTKTYGGSQDDDAVSIVAATGGGYIVGAYTKSNDGDVHGNHGDSDTWILKLNEAGDTIWTKTFGGTAADGPGFITLAADGGYAIAGYTNSNNGDVHGNNGGQDMWLFKINNDGALIWSHTYGGSNFDEARSITATPGGGFVIAGLTSSSDKDVSGFHTPLFSGFDMFIVKVDGNGNKIWTRAIGGTKDDVAIGITPSPGGYAVTGYTNSNDGDVKGFHGLTNSSLSNDVLVVKLDENGNKIWANAYGGTAEDVGLSIIATTDGGYAVAGGASSKNGDVTGYTGNDGALDMWVLKLDADGNKQWGKIVGGSGDDYLFSIFENNNDLVIAGLTDSNDGDMSNAPSHGDFDIWIATLTVE